MGEEEEGGKRERTTNGDRPIMVRPLPVASGERELVILKPKEPVDLMIWRDPSSRTGN